MMRDLSVVTFGALAKWRACCRSVSTRPTVTSKWRYLKSGSSPNVRAVKRHDHWAAFGAAHPMRAGIIEGLQTIRGPGETTPDARVVGGLGCWQQHAHHLGSLSKRQPGAEFGLDAHKLRRSSLANQR
jgi:hypothetical protein